MKRKIWRFTENGQPLEKPVEEWVDRPQSRGGGEVIIGQDNDKPAPKSGGDSPHWVDYEP